MMTLCYLGLGSNLRSPERQIRKALQKLQKTSGVTIHKLSSLYFTQPLGQAFQPVYCNMVLSIFTKLTPIQLLRCCQAIEKKQQRVRKKKWGSRTLDIDLLFYGGRKIHTKVLTVPHPELIHRDFVMKPLLEILGPVYQETLDRITH